MKTTLVLPVFFLLSFIASAQNADSLSVVKQVDSLIQVSRVLTGQRDFDKALEVNAVAEKFALEKLGRESAAYGSCCQNRGRVNYINRDYPEAEKWFLEALAIREKTLGNHHPDYAITLYILANLYTAEGNFEKAEPLYLEAKAIQETALGKENQSYAFTLSNLSSLYCHLGKFEESVPLSLESSTIIAKIFGKEHTYYALAIANLAAAYDEMGSYDKAEPLYIEVIAIREKTLGKETPDYASSLHNLAGLYIDIEYFEKAEILILEAKAIREKTLGKEHPHYASSLNSLAVLYMILGNYSKAEPLYLESKTILERVLGKEHPDYARVLFDLAGMYSNMADYEKAEPLYLEAKSIQEKAIGKEHPYYLATLQNLANLYFLMGRYDKSEPLLLETTAIGEKVWGKKHHEFALSLLSLANLYSATGNYEKAAPLYLEAKTIWEKSQGKEHSTYAAILFSLANLYEHQERYSTSEPLLEEYYKLTQISLSRSASFLSEHELAKYIADFQVARNGLTFSLLTQQSKSRPTSILPSLCYNHSLFQKGFLLSAACRLNALATGTPEAKALNDQIKGCHRRLAAEYAKPIIERKDIIELEEKVNSAEKELARSVSGYAEAIQQVNWQELRAVLKKDEAAIEFVHFQLNFPQKTDSTMYAALILLQSANLPIFVPLLEEKQLDTLLKISNNRKADFVNGLYYLADRGVIVVGKPQKTLYDLLWKPLEKDLSGIKTIYYSPAGLLHRLNLAAIPINLDSVLGDRYQLVELGSTRQMVVPNQIKPGANDALLFGGIQYDSDSTAILKSIASIDSVSIAFRGELNFFYTDSTLRVGTWGRLPFTDREVGNLERILKTAGIQTQTSRGYAASEEAFKTIGAVGKSSPRILHIATHGFFFPDPKTVGSRPSALGGEPVFKISEHPMIRSGLLLAGANHAWKTGKPLKPGMEDGILTAYEISQMNLSNTELVVLSACETGLGDIEGNEGVYGLQRAFKIAGAKYLIMSLWQVPDKQTSLLMTTFYKKWLEEKMTIPEAFRAAQKELRDAGLDPYQWAGFVLVE